MRCYASNYTEKQLRDMASVAVKNMVIDETNQIHINIDKVFVQFIKISYAPGDCHYSSYVGFTALPNGYSVGKPNLDGLKEP